MAVGTTIHVPLSMDGNAITDVDDPTNAQDAATKTYVDSVAGGGGPLAYGTRTSNRTTTGTTFGTGIDILAAALSFTADGTKDYAVDISAPAAAHSAANGIVDFYLNLDSADAGYFADTRKPTAGHQYVLNARTVILAPSAGSHTVNVRMVSGTAGTSTLVAGAGGAGVARPCLVTVSEL